MKEIRSLIMYLRGAFLLVFAAFFMAGCALRGGLVIDSATIQALPDETPWHRRVAVGPGARVVFEFEKTTKGNGWLAFPGGGARIYDAHDDGLVFDPYWLEARLVDLDHDGYLDLELTGNAVGFADKDGREVERRRVRAVFWFNPRTETFGQLISDPWIYTQ